MYSRAELDEFTMRIQDQLAWMEEENKQLSVGIMEGSMETHCVELLIMLVPLNDMESPSAEAGGTDNLWNHVDGTIPGYAVAHHVDPSREGFFTQGNVEAFLFLPMKQGPILPFEWRMGGMRDDLE